MAWPDAVISADPFSLLFAYYAIGCGVYFALEHWGLELSLYFLTQAALTVGYGDVVPHSATARKAEKEKWVDHSRVTDVSHTRHCDSSPAQLAIFLHLEIALLVIVDSVSSLHEIS